MVAKRRRRALTEKQKAAKSAYGRACSKGRVFTDKQNEDKRAYMREYGPRYYAANKDKVLERSRLWGEANKANRLFTGAKHSAKRRGIEFALSLEDVVIPEVCPILGLKLNHTAGPQSDNLPSLDRIDNGRGYVKGNVHVVSWRANKVKGQGTLKELRLLVAWLQLKGLV